MVSKEQLKNRIPILLVDDDEDDIHLVKRAFQKGRILNKLYVAHDGEEALDFLYHRGDFENHIDLPRPGIILLDLNMPRMDGRETLQVIKADENLQSIPIIVLTTSDAEKDILESYKHGANSFITKPVEFSKFLEAVVTIGKYWLSIAEVPEITDEQRFNPCIAIQSGETNKSESC